VKHKVLLTFQPLSCQKTLSYPPKGESRSEIFFMGVSISSYRSSWAAEKSNRFVSTT